MKDCFSVKGNNKDYYVGDIVQVAGVKGKVIWRNSARNLLQNTGLWDSILESGDKIACVKLCNDKEVYLIF